MQMKEGAPVNDDPGLEHEADVMGAKAVAITQQVTDPAAMENIPASDLSPVQQVAQRMTLNGYLVDEAKPYPNDNQDAVLTHMAGEWDVANALAVTGGHLLAAMVAQWGAAVPNSVPDARSPTGVHFAGGLPGNNITPHQHTFRLVAANPARQGQTKISNPKESTFWPANWSAANLAHTLNNSYQNGRANEWASKARMTYWYRWQTLGDNTLFPIAKVANPVGTLRNRMKAGRQAAQMRAASEPKLNGAGLSDDTQLVQRRASPYGFPAITNRQGVVQRHISWDGANNQFVIDNTRPGWMGTAANMPVGMLQSRSGIESLSGMSLDSVKVHYNSAQLAQLNALAYAQGSDIHLAPGQEQHLQHEAWHVVQQAQGRVRPTMQMKDGVPANDEKTLEREADVMGAAAIIKQVQNVVQHEISQTPIQMHSSPRMVAQRRQLAGAFGSGQVVQRYVQDEPNAGDKSSKDGALIFCGEQELYAGTDQFEQANAIGGQLLFNKGPAHKSRGELRRVIPVYKSGAQVANESATYESVERAEYQNRLLNDARVEYIEKSARDALLNTAMETLEDGWESISAQERKAQFGAEVFENVEENVCEVAGHWLDLLLAIFPISRFEESRIAANFQAYLHKQIDNGNSILMPSDCGKAAFVILGKDPSQDLQAIQPGGVHIYTPSVEGGGNREKWEWEHHYAAIIMTDGDDHVTMENAGGKASDRVGKLAFDKTWFFEMYGREEDQTFNKKYAKDFGD
jgi:hypothetical protein